MIDKTNKKDSPKTKVKHIEFGEGTIVRYGFDDSNLIFSVQFHDQIVRNFPLENLSDKSLFTVISQETQKKRICHVEKVRTLNVGDVVSRSPNPDKFSMDTFGTHTYARWESAFFIPTQWRRKNENKYIVWYTNFNSNPRRYHNKQIWTDVMYDDGDRITRTYIDDDVEKLSEEDLRWNDSKFLVFGWDYGAYKFYGVFQIEKIEELEYIQITYKKTSNSVTYKMRIEQ